MIHWFYFQFTPLCFQIQFWMCENAQYVIILACSLLSSLLKVTEKGENQSLTCAKSDERLTCTAHRCLCLHLICSSVLCWRGCRPGWVWWDERLGRCFELDPDTQAPDELFPGTGNCCWFNGHFGEENWARNWRKITVSVCLTNGFSGHTGWGELQWE